MAHWTDRAASWLDRRPFALFALLYLAIGAIAYVGLHTFPAPLLDAAHALTGGAGLGAAEPILSRRDLAAAAPPAAPVWAMAALAMLSAGLLALAQAWLYTITRQKRGYQQSVVHSLVLLPVIVAGVVVLVKFNLALAFSLAGIVAAVRFRNTLEDSKDAVYLFAATAIGLAAGVDLLAAATLSVTFSFVTLLLFRSDFARSPALLAGELAEVRLRRALEEANRSGEFVSRVDHEVLASMSPAQLDALADRAWRRHKEATPGATGDEPERFDGILSVRTDGSDPARGAVEAILVRSAKRWKFLRVATAEDGMQALEFAVRLRKSTAPSVLIESLRSAATAGVLDAELK